MSRSFDIDIDVKSGVDKEKYGTRAMVYNDEAENILPHPSGYYLQEVPVDSLTGNAAVDYKDGAEKNLLKVDVLTNSSYDIFESKDELLQLIEQEPDWDLLTRRDIVERLPHIGKHYDLVSFIQPRDVEELADCLALIRPGKTHLTDAYLDDKAKVRRKLYQRPKEGIYFKRSHAISYAVMIAAILCKIEETIISW